MPMAHLLQNECDVTEAASEKFSPISAAPRVSPGEKDDLLKLQPSTTVFQNKEQESASGAYT